MLIAREKALYKEDGNNLVKIGEQPDVIKGTEYDMNLVLHFVNAGGAWSYETTKVQGMLGQIFPLGKQGKQIPFEKLFAYASKVKPRKTATPNA